MGLCEHHSGCEAQATCRLSQRNVHSSITVFRHYCRRHLAEKERTIDQSEPFDVVDVTALV